MSFGIGPTSQTQLTYVEPSLREYLQNIRTAISSNDLPVAQQALALRSKATQSSASGETSPHATGVSQDLQSVGKALEAGDLSGTAQASDEFHQNTESISEVDTGQQAPVPESAPTKNTDTISWRASVSSNLNESA